jgi:uncharacterized membrane protein
MDTERRSDVRTETDLNRREFARRLASGIVLAATTMATSTAEAAPPAPLVQQAPAEPAALPAEVEARWQAIEARYGARLDEAQKKLVRELLLQQHRALTELRSFPLDNADEPALPFRLWLQEA